MFMKYEVIPTEDEVSLVQASEELSVPDPASTEAEKAIAAGTLPCATQKPGDLNESKNPESIHAPHGLPV